MPTIYFVVFNQAEVLDFSGPFDVFSMARIATGMDPYDMQLISVGGAQIEGIHGFSVVPHAAIADVTPGPDDIVILPGGAMDVIDAIGAGDPLLGPVPNYTSPLTPEQKAALAQECAAIVAWLKDSCQGAGLIATVCVGAFFAARAGLFNGLQITTHHGLISVMNQWVGTQSKLPPAEQAIIKTGARYVSNPDSVPLIQCSAGVSAGLDLAMYLLEQITCPNARELTQVLMEYNGTSNFADPPVSDLPCDLRFCGYRADGKHLCKCAKSGAIPPVARQQCA